MMYVFISPVMQPETSYFLSSSPAMAPQMGSVSVAVADLFTLLKYLHHLTFLLVASVVSRSLVQALWQ